MDNNNNNGLDDVTHIKLLSWVEESRKRCQPDNVHWCTGSASEYASITNQLVANGTFIKLNEKKRPGSFLARTDTRDVESVMDKTFVCGGPSHKNQSAAHLWGEPKKMKDKLNQLFSGCMTGRTMYIVPFCMGPLTSRWRKIGVFATDSLYAVTFISLSMQVGTHVLKNMDQNESFLPTLHSVGVPLHFGQRDSSWPCSPDNSCVALFPDDDVPNTMAFGSVFGFLSDRNVTLRLASTLSKKNPQFIAANSAIVSIQSPEGHQKYICLAMPDGTTQGGGAFEVSTLPGWSSRCVSAEVTWLNVGQDGRLYGLNPFIGFTGQLHGVSDYTHRSLMDSIQQNTIFTNCAITKERDVWWEGMTKDPPADLFDWTGQKWIPGHSSRHAAHPKASYAVSMNHCPILDPEWNNPEGVPISAIIFGLRNEKAYPLVYEAFNWIHGVFWASLLPIAKHQENSSIIPAKRSPLAMDSACGINISDYIDTWKNIRKYLGYSSPKIFFVNFFREENGNKLWGGFEENFRIYKWIFQRVDGQRDAADARKTPIGYVPTIRSFDFSGLDMQIDHKQSLFKIQTEDIVQEIEELKTFNTATLGNHPHVSEQIESLEQHVGMDESHPPTENKVLIEWVNEIRKLCKPNSVKWCDGSESEYDEMCSLLVKQGTFIPLNQQLKPNCYVARSDPRDVARVESKTFICCEKEEDAGPTNNWMDPTKMRERLNSLFNGCMKGRVMYVIPFCMGPLGSPYSRFGVEISDSPYVVVNMKIMTRIGTRTLIYMKNSSFLPCLHSVGQPLEADQKDVTWPCNPEQTVIAHFPQDPRVMSFGSGYGGNALLGKKCYALRIATVMGKREGWLAEHMLILSLTSPENNKYYIAAAFPSACGKTNLAMLVPTLPGWVVRTIGDDIAWMHVSPDGSLNAINPENGFFGVAPGTSEQSNPSMMRTINRNTIYTNVGITPEGDVWWEGLSKTPPAECIDWKGEKWTPGCGRLAAHPNSRFTAPAKQCPVIDPMWMNPNGVPISAILFGGRRNTLVPLVVEAFSWQHGIFLGSSISSETTAAAEGNLGSVRRDPFAMLPFCGYNMGDYWNHWLDIRKSLGYNSPKIFYVNWFRKNSQGQYVWPGFGENSRVLKWVCCRIGRNPTARAVRTPIGLVPAMNELDTSGLDIDDETLKNLTEVDCNEWLGECKMIRDFYGKFGDRCPKKLLSELDELEKRLAIGSDHPAPTSNQKIIDWVDHIKSLCKPARVQWCNGSNEENEELCSLLVKQGTFTPVTQRPGSYLARSNPADVARVESKTFICTTDKEDAGVTNNWCDPEEMKKRLDKLFDGCMAGRTMYVIPFSMGPIGSPYSKFGIEISDSAYVVVNMRIMTRMGLKVLNLIDENKFFLPCLHSVGVPLKPLADKSQPHPQDPWPCNPEQTVIAHFPETMQVMSFGSGYGGNALLGKKCYSLRIASVLGKKEGWLAEHMLILGITSPAGKKYYVAAAFPSACGKTNLAMLVPSLPGWIVRCVGDDIAWLHVGEDGRLFAINPENGFFGVAPGTSSLSNPSAMESIKKNSIFTNVGLTPDGDVWWEGMTKVPPAELIDWKGEKWTPGCGRLAAHPNSRYTAPAYQCPVIDPEWENTEGVPICAILFGGRREKVVPLVTEANIWEQGVFMGSIISSEQTAAAEGTLGQVRRDPFAMLPFCGYNMADYFSHWMEFRKKLGFLSPKIFYVNWFRKENGKFLWPGFGENCRVLKWVCERVDGVGKFRSTPIGLVPTHDAIDIGGLDIEQDVMHKLLSVDANLWLKELDSIKEYYATFGKRFPKALMDNLHDLEKRLLIENTAPTTNSKLVNWVDTMKNLCQPDHVQWCKGTREEYDDLCDNMVSQGSLIRLNNDVRPNSFLVRTDPADIEKDVENTYVCTERKEDAGPLNKWADPVEMKQKMSDLLKGSMKGRTMYVLVYCMGPIGSVYSRFGVQVTDSPHVVISTLLQTRIGSDVLNVLKDTDDFFSCVHSVGVPLKENQVDVAWPCNISQRHVVYFSTQTEGYNVMSYGSAWGSNAVACRIPHGIKSASMLMRTTPGNTAETCAVIGITSPKGKRIYVAAFLPKGCGKTALSMIIPTIPGWTVRVLSDDIAWLHVAEDGKLWAINPMKGFYDVASGTSERSNRAMFDTISKDTLFTNVALTEDGDIWWEGKTDKAPEKLIDWKGQPWTPQSTSPAASENSRFTVSAHTCPLLDPAFENPNGVKISALIFGGKRKSVFPLVVEASSWEQGVFLASCVSKDNTRGELKREPFAAPFLGCDINEYMKSWLNIRALAGYNIPKIFMVNWFREDSNGNVLWPGFRENSRVLKWIHDRATDSADGVVKTPIGLIPEVESLDLRGCGISETQIKKSLAFNKQEWKKECESISAFYQSLGPGLPTELKNQLDSVTNELNFY